jgi:hypothetical protein
MIKKKMNKGKKNESREDKSYQEATLGKISLAAFSRRWPY